MAEDLISALTFETARHILSSFGIFSSVPKEVMDCVVCVSMRGNKVHRHMMLRCVFQEVTDPCCSGGCGAADAQSGTDTLQIACCVIVQLEVAFLPWDAAPEINIWLVPDFEVPLRNFIDAVSIDEMLREMRHQAVPLFHAFGW